jgi:dihydroorotate dehydrogenase
LLGELAQANQRFAQEHAIAPRPLLVKIAPDLTWQEIDEIIAAATASHVNGIIATNTTLARDGLQSDNQNEKGGLSGVPVRERSLAVVKYLADNTTMPIIGVGGIRNASHVQAQLDAGASLVQIYTGLIYEGPGMAGNILRELG